MESHSTRLQQDGVIRLTNNHGVDMNARELVSYISHSFHCTAPNHNKEDIYTLFEVNIERNGALIQKPDDFKPHWVNAKFIKKIKY